MKKINNAFFKKGYLIINFFSKKEVDSLLNKIEKDFRKNAKKEKITIEKLKNYHKANFDEKIHNKLMHPNDRQVKLPGLIVKKILSNKIIKSISSEFYGNKTTKIFQEYKNILRANYAGLRIAKPFSDISGIHAEYNSEEEWDPITVWCPIVGFNKNYSLNISPYSHKIVHPINRIIKDKYLARSYDEKYLKNFKFYRPNLKVGQVIIFHPNLLHGGSKCTGRYTRVSTEIRIMRVESFRKIKNHYTLPKNSLRKIRFSKIK